MGWRVLGCGVLGVWVASCAPTETSAGDTKAASLASTRVRLLSESHEDAAKLYELREAIYVSGRAADAEQCPRSDFDEDADILSRWVLEDDQGEFLAALQLATVLTERSARDEQDARILPPSDGSERFYDCFRDMQQPSSFYRYSFDAFRRYAAPRTVQVYGFCSRELLRGFGSRLFEHVIKQEASNNSDVGMTYLTDTRGFYEGCLPRCELFEVERPYISLLSFHFPAWLMRTSDRMRCTRVHRAAWPHEPLNMGAGQRRSLGSKRDDP